LRNLEESFSRSFSYSNLVWCTSLEFMDFGWNGFLLQIPREARLVSEGGNARSGYMRLETENYFFEVKWEEAQQKKVKPLSEVVEAFIKKLEKDTKQKIPVRGRRKTNVSGHDTLVLSLKSAMEERIYFWYCEESLRITILRCVFKLIDTNSRTIIRQIVASFKCHGGESNLWTPPQSIFRAPSNFQLTERKMMIGRTYLLLLEHKVAPFTERRREIFFEYNSMASIRFEDEYKDPNKWVEKRYLKDLKKRYRGIKFHATAEEKINGHTAIIKEGSARTGLTTRKSSLYANATWYCEDLNRIYSVTTSEHVARPWPLKRKMDEKTFEEFSREFLSTIKCH